MKLSRKTERGLWLAATCILSVALIGAVTVDDDLETLMKRKLASAQSLLDALAREDFAKISTSTEELKLISQEAQWKRIMTKDYHQMSSEFRATADRMGEMAEKRNLDGATLGYMQMVMNCVECHKVVRNGAQIAAAKK